MKIDLVPHVSLDFKLRELHQKGVITQTPIYREGWGRGHCWSIDNRRLKIVSGFVGTPSWRSNTGVPIYFTQPHDIAIDEKNDTIIAWAPT